MQLADEVPISGPVKCAVDLWSSEDSNGVQGNEIARFIGESYVNLKPRHQRFGLYQPGVVM